MAPVLLIGRLPAANKAGQQKIIAGMAKIAAFAKENDPETTKHASHVLFDGSDDKNVWAIEEYTSQAACDEHMKWDTVKEFMETYKTDPDLHGGEPEIWHSNQVELFTRPELAKHENPFVLLAKVNYKLETFNEGLEGWKPVVANAKSKETGTLTYSVGKDVEHENRLTLVEAYESEKYLKEVHFAGAAVQEKMKQEEKLRAAESDVVFLKLVAGYWQK